MVQHRVRGIKRGQQTADSLSVKRRQLPLPENPNIGINTTKLYDLNDDCLLYMFKKLSVSDLLGVAQTCRRFKELAAYTFGKKYSLMRVNIANMHMPDVLTDSKHALSLSNFRMTLKFLRCFGCYVQFLYIDYTEGREYYWHIVNAYIGFYCCDSIITMESHGLIATMEFAYSFTKLRNLRFVDCTLNYDLTNFNLYFPNLRRLEFLDRCQVNDRRCLERQIHHLEHLAIDMNHLDGPITFNQPNITECLRLNQQLRSLRVIGSVLDANFMRQSSIYMQNLEFLSVCWDFSAFDDTIVHLRNVKRFKIIFDTDRMFCYENSPASKIPFRLDAMEELTLDLGQFYMSDAVADFISSHKHLHKLNVRQIIDPDFDPFGYFEDKMKLAKAASMIRDITMSECVFTGDEVVAFLDECVETKKFRFRLDAGDSIFDDMMQKVKEGWTESLELDDFDGHDDDGYDDHEANDIIQLERP